MKRWCVLLYGLACYLSFLVSFSYLAAWLGNLVVPRSIDSSPNDPLLAATAINVALIGVFGVQHSLMARPGFKRWLTRFIPQPAERATYVLCTSLALLLLFWQWRPLGGTIWDVRDPQIRVVMYSLFAFGWLAVVATTFLINHFDLFGLRQVWLYFRNRPYQPLQFRTPGPYRLIRHPLYVGWIIAFWATPTMTVSHLLFAFGMTAYILVAIPFEERDLAAFHGSRYEDYQRRTGRLLPRVSPSPATSSFSEPTPCKVETAE